MELLPSALGFYHVGVRDNGCKKCFTGWNRHNEPVRQKNTQWFKKVIIREGVGAADGLFQVRKRCSAFFRLLFHSISFFRRKKWIQSSSDEPCQQFKTCQSKQNAWWGEAALCVTRTGVQVRSPTSILSTRLVSFISQTKWIHLLSQSAAAAGWQKISPCNQLGDEAATAPACSCHAGLKRHPHARRRALIIAIRRTVD